MNDKARDYWNNTASANSDWRYYQPDNPERLQHISEIIKMPERAFPSAMYPLIKKYIGNFQGKKICVPSSGDNLAVFGFHLLGAKVTSCDISQNQINNAKSVADKHNWNIEFFCQDSMILDKISNNEYDLVYTSNGVHVWIGDLPEMYKNFYRLLKKGGYNIFFETHPVCRPFDNTTYEIKIKKHYEDVCSLEYECPEYSWRTQDFVNAVTSASFVIKEMQEFHSVREDLNPHNYLRVDDNDNYKWPGDTFDWKVNPWAALPQCLCLCSQKV